MADVVRQARVPGDRVITVGSLRGGDADVRLPAGLTGRLGAEGSRIVGRLLWGRAGHVHRANIDIPPAPLEILTILDLAPNRFADEGTLPATLADQVQRARGVVVSTETMAAEIRDTLAPREIFFVPPAVDPQFFQDRSPTEAGRPYVLHVGGATRRKGLDHLAAAWRILAADHPDLELVLAGPPHPTGRRALLAARDVRYVGQPDSTDLVGLMRGARALVVPSTYEGFGMPVAEAMALGTPVVVINGTAPAEVGGDVAFAAALADVDSLADQLTAAARARDDDPLRLAAGRARARRWSHESVAAQQQDVYARAFTVD